MRTATHALQEPERVSQRRQSVSLSARGEHRLRGLGSTSCLGLDGVESQPCHVAAVHLWTSFPISLSISALLCNTEIRFLLIWALQGSERWKWNHTCDGCGLVPLHVVRTQSILLNIIIDLAGWRVQEWERQEMRLKKWGRARPWDAFLPCWKFLDFSKVVVSH